MVVKSPLQGMYLSKTKIVCTIGPSSIAPVVISQLLEAGMNVARINASHGTVEEHAECLEVLRREAKKLTLSQAVVLDPPAPKDQPGNVKKGGVKLMDGAAWTLTTRDLPGDESQASVELPELPHLVKLEQTILIINIEKWD